MGKHVRLAFVPGCPVRLESLCPKSYLLMIQSRLASKGITTDVVDFGTLESIVSDNRIDVDGTGELISGWMEQLSRGWGGFPVWFKMVPEKQARAENLLTTLRQTLLEKDSPQVLVYWVETREDLREILTLSHALRFSQPEMSQILAGPYAVHYGACLLSGCPTVDAVITGDVTGALLSFLDAGGIRGAWSTVPGVLCRDGDGVVQPSEQFTVFPETVPLNFTYFQRPGRKTQFPLYQLSYSEVPASWYYQDHCQGKFKLKSTAVLVEEIEFLQRHYGASVFHISAAHVVPEDLLELTDMLLERNLVTIYSLGDINGSIGSTLAGRLFASGCRSIGFRMPTGSQRMLEDFYGCKTGVSTMAASVRNCKVAGIFTVAWMCFPSPVDDYHTQSETELFIKSAGPESVCIESPALTPESIWFKHSHEYGFFISHKEYHRFVMGGHPAYGDLPYTMRGWSAKRIHQSQASLIAYALKAGCMVDVSEQQGVLARFMRSVTDEPEFLEALRDALDRHNVDLLKMLARRVNDNARTLSESSLAARELVGTVMFST